MFGVWVLRGPAGPLFHDEGQRGLPFSRANKMGRIAAAHLLFLSFSSCVVTRTLLFSLFHFPILLGAPFSSITTPSMGESPSFSGR